MRKNKFAVLMTVMAVGYLFVLYVAYAVPQPDDPGLLKSITGGRQSVPVKVYKLVRFASRLPDGPDIDSGDVVTWNTVSDDGVTVALTTTSMDGAIAGIAVTAITTADSASNTAADDDGKRNWGYIIVHGITAADITAGGAGSAAVGEAFYTSSDSGTIAAFVNTQSDVLGASQGTVQTIVNSRSGGFFMDTPAATDTSVQVFVTLE